MESNVDLAIAIFLFTAFVGFVLARRIGQSAVLWEILLGVIVGPAVLGFVSYDGAVKVLAELGAIFLLFTIGLECDYKQVYNLKNSIIALFGVIVPFIGGWLLSRAFGYNNIEGLFIATALTATSIAITAHILKERGMLHTQTAKTIIGAAVVDDILGLIVLSIISGLHGDTSSWGIGLKIAQAIGFVILCILFIKPMNFIIRKVDEKFHEHQITILAAMAIAFGYAGIAAYIGLSSIVGAFLAGVTLESVNIKSFKEGAVYFEMLFSAIFFISLGLLVDVASIGGVWIFAIALILVAVITKLIGCIIPAKLSGHTWRESFTVGLGMVPRGEVAMVVALMGLTAGIITKNVYTAIILMAFVTTILTPIFLQFSLREEKHVEKAL